jgi:23S rRNA pseudouridine1911/1915/1917 synthase
LIIYAKNPLVHKGVMMQFKKGEVRKRYYAFVRGRLKKRRGILKGKIIDREAKIFSEKKKEALTFYRVLAESDDFSFVDLEPKTGRTNQLRIQLANIGCPILGEDKYAFRRDFKVRFKRLALHAYFLSFRHPISKERIDLNIGLAEDMDLFLKRREE